MSKEIRIPGPDHPITIEPSSDHVTVRAGGATLAESSATLVLQEANYPPVRYIPLGDLDRSKVSRSETSTYCPYKGDASYFSIAGDVPDGEDAIWFYDQPYPAVEPIRGHVAFYANRVEIDIQPA